MVTHVPKDTHQPSRKDMVKHHPHDGQPTTVEWSPTIPGMVITFHKTVTHHLQDGPQDLQFDSSTTQLVLILLLWLLLL